jgi:hypothetical protein
MACSEALEISRVVSRSMRSPCWCSAMMRVLRVVGRPASSTTAPTSTPSLASSERSRRPWGPVPTTPATATRAPNRQRFLATLAAPPRVTSSFSTETTGTGASGEIRSTCPQTYSSSIRSPTTSRRHRSNAEKSGLIDVTLKLNINYRGACRPRRGCTPAAAPPGRRDRHRRVSCTPRPGVHHYPRGKSGSRT